MRSSDGPIVPRVEVHGVRPGRAGTRHATTRMVEMLAALSPRPTAAELRFIEENGPRGGEDVRCALTVKLPRRPSVHVAGTAGSPRVAFDAAFAKLERRLGRLRGASRDRRRQPRKYFVAAGQWREAG